MVVELPTATDLLALYKKVFGAGRENTLTRLSDQEKKNILWFCSSAAAVVSSRKAVGNGKKKTTYRERVTHSDEAFALMALQFHQEKWTEGDDPSGTEEQQPPRKKRKRVTGAGNSKSKKYYTDTMKELYDFRKNNKDKYTVAEAWLEKEIRKKKKPSGTGDAEADAPEATGEAEEEVEDCSDIVSEMIMNPAFVKV